MPNFETTGHLQSDMKLYGYPETAIFTRSDNS
jgi:hypothetical protein